MYIHHGQKWVFVSTPKCGTNTMYRVIPELFPEAEPVQPLFHNNRIPAGCDGYLKWSIVRHPCSRAVSLWRSTIHGNQRHIFHPPCGSDEFEPFMEWVLTDPAEIVRRHLRPSQAEWQDGLSLDRILHLDRLDQEVGTLSFWPSSGKRLPRMNVCSGHQWRQHMTVAALALIKTWAPDDCDQFGYRWPSPVEVPVCA